MNSGLEVGMAIRVLLADSVAGIRETEKALLEKEPDIEVVGEAGDEFEAVRLIDSLQPQVVLTDFGLRPTGKVFSKQVKSQNPRTKVLGVTELKGRYVRNFLTAFGADELLDKKDLESKLAPTLRLVAQSRSR
jgi:DNA-binding NarL/FixJ family response regulator